LEKELVYQILLSHFRDREAEPDIEAFKLKVDLLLSESDETESQPKFSLSISAKEIDTIRQDMNTIIEIFEADPQLDHSDSQAQLEEFLNLHPEKEFYQNIQHYLFPLEPPPSFLDLVLSDVQAGVYAPQKRIIPQPLENHKLSLEEIAELLPDDIAKIVSQEDSDVIQFLEQVKKTSTEIIEVESSSEIEANRQIDNAIDDIPVIDKNQSKKSSSRPPKQTIAQENNEDLEEQPRQDTQVNSQEDNEDLAEQPRQDAQAQLQKLQKSTNKLMSKVRDPLREIIIPKKRDLLGPRPSAQTIDFSEEREDEIKETDDEASNEGLPEHPQISNFRPSPIKAKLKSVYIEPLRKRVRWSLEETDQLLMGIKEFGCGKWKEIKDQFQFHPTRRPIDLKDRWRTLQRQADRIADQFQDQREKKKRKISSS